MEQQLDRVEKNVDKILDKLSEHSLLLVRHTLLHEQNTKDLTHHIMRTDILEEMLEKKTTELRDADDNLNKAIGEAKLPMLIFRTLAKWSGWVTAIVGAGASVWAILHHFLKVN